MIGRIHEMFDFEHIVGHGTCRDMVRVQYPNLDISYLPPLEDMNEFLAEIDEGACMSLRSLSFLAMRLIL